MAFMVFLDVNAAEYTDEHMTNFIDNTSNVLTPYSIDKLPIAQIKYNLTESGDCYQIKLTVDENETDIVTLSPTKQLVLKTFEFPVTNEGAHQLNLSLLKNGIVLYEKDYSSDYIKKVSSVSYNDKGFNTHFTHNTYYAEDAELLDAIGASVYREPIYWWIVELSAGNYNFNTLDTRLAKMKNNTQEKVFVLTGTSPIYLNDNGTEKILTKAQIDAFAKFAVEVAKHYPDVLCFEIYNEPQFNYSGSEYKAIVLETAKRLKEYNQNIQVYAGSVVDNDSVSQTGEEFTNIFFDKELYPYIDGISSHIYTVGYFADCIKWNNPVNTMLAKIRNSGGWKKYGITETGYYIISGDWGPVEETQASELIKRAVISDDAGVSPLTFYALKNRGKDKSVEEDNWGVYTNDYRMRKSYYAVKEFFKNTNQAIFLGKINLDNVSTAYAYVNNGEYFIMAWAPSPENTNTNIRNSYLLKTSSYTFEEDVVITDLYGNKIEGNVLSTSYEPKYVYGLSREFIIDALGKQNSQNFISEDVFANTSYNVSELKQKYNNIITEKTEASVNEYIDYCLNFGISIINDFRTSSTELTVLEVSAMLSEIEKAAEKGARLITCCDISKILEPDKMLNMRYNQLENLIEFSDLAGLSYLSEPYKKGKELLKMSEKYGKNNRIEPINQKHYKIDAVGNITVFGETNSEFVTVKIVSEGEYIVVDALPTSNNKYSQVYRLPEFGNYELEIKADTRISEQISYKNTEYKSTEAKMMNSNIMIAEGLLEWSQLLMEEYLENNKGYTFADNRIDDYEIITENEKCYISIKISDGSDISIGAVYSQDGRLLTFGIAEDNNIKLEITDLSDYIIKIFRWSSLDNMKPLDKTETYLSITE